MKLRLFAVLCLVLGLYSCNNVNSSPSGIVNPTTISWIPPTTNTDGTPVDDGAGYGLHCGNVSGGPYPLDTDIFGWAITAIDARGKFANGDWYCVMTAYDTSGNRSTYSPEGNFRIDEVAPNAPSGLKFTL